MNKLNTLAPCPATTFVLKDGRVVDVAAGLAGEDRIYRRGYNQATGLVGHVAGKRMFGDEDNAEYCRIESAIESWAMSSLLSGGVQIIWHRGNWDTPGWAEAVTARLVPCENAIRAAVVEIERGQGYQCDADDRADITAQWVDWAKATIERREKFKRDRLAESAAASKRGERYSRSLGGYYPRSTVEEFDGD
ncbi:MAG TPA: hypothetical protein VGN72_00320 [Tepidisphaeraceae bacterium]|jgi:hypothetical protein|nr:hypothetical protein [Tepidisphaeraceae bacterium]